MRGLSAWSMRGDAHRAVYNLMLGHLAERASLGQGEGKDELVHGGRSRRVGGQLAKIRKHANA
jgi:hypothetical protein